MSATVCSLGVFILYTTYNVQRVKIGVCVCMMKIEDEKSVKYRQAR